MSIVDFFTRKITEPYRPYQNYDSKYMLSSIDLLLQQAKRNKSVRENKIFDYLAVEGDPFYSRRVEQNYQKLLKYTSDLSMVTQSVSAITAKLDLIRVLPFIPVHIQKLLLNFQTVVDTTSYAITGSQQLLSFKQIEAVFLDDLKLQLGNKVITYQQIVLMYNNILNSLKIADSVKNTSLKPLLGSGILELFPRDISTTITESIQYIDKVDEIFELGTPEFDLFNTGISNLLGLYSKKKVSDIVKNDYNDLDITFDDPLGINTLGLFLDELKTDFSNDVLEELNTHQLGDTDKQELLDIINQEYNNLIDDTFTGTLGLPSLFEVSEAIVNNSSNKTREHIINSFNTLTLEIMDEMGIDKNSVTNSPVDYLVHVKTNLEKRLEMKLNNDVSDNFKLFDNFIKTAYNKKIITEPEIETLNNNLNKYFK